MKKRGSKTRTIVRYARRGAMSVRRRLRRAPGPMEIGIGGYILGMAESRGLLAKLPTIVADPVLNAGLVLWAAERFGGIKNKWLHDGATAALAIGGYRMGSGGAGIHGDETVLG